MQWGLVLLLLMGECSVTVCRLYECHYVPESRNWTEAQQHCRRKNSDLITITNMEDMEALVRGPPQSKAQAWIGLYYPEQGNRSWYWSLPEEEFKDTETNWRAGEPNDMGTENCAAVTSTHLWDDVTCMEKRHFLCFGGNKASVNCTLIKEQKTFLEAQSYCRENHTDLVSGLKQALDPQCNQSVLTGYNNAQSQYVYIGLFRDSWRWSDGSTSSFRYWNLQMNMRQKNSGQCAMIDEGRWRNDSCAQSKPFYCCDDKVILITESKTWEDALYYCRDHHHDLVTITDSADQRWVQEKVKKASSPFVWTGLRYSCTLGFWFWVSDELVSYENWAPDRPGDHCDMSGAVKATGGQKWFSHKDTETFNFLCSEL